MDATIHISPDTYRLLQRRATEIRSTPDGLADTALRLQLGNSAHIEQRLTPHGAQAYVRGTRVAVRHVAAFLKTGYTIEEISRTGLAQLPAAAVYEAAAYYYDHQAEIETELAAESEETTREMLQQRLSTEQVAKLTGHAA